MTDTLFPPNIWMLADEGDTFWRARFYPVQQVMSVAGTKQVRYAFAELVRPVIDEIEDLHRADLIERLEAIAKARGPHPCIEGEAARALRGRAYTVVPGAK